MATTIPIAVSLLATAATSEVMANKQKKSQKKIQSSIYQNQMQQLNAKQAAQDTQRKQQLGRLSAAQRARFSALGIGSNEGSAGAVLEGLKKRSAESAASQADISNALRNGLTLRNNESLLSQKSTKYKNNVDLLIGQK